MTSILAIDPSTTSMGFAFTYRGFETGLVQASPKLDRPNRFHIMRRHLEAQMADCHPAFVVYYTPFGRGLDATRCQWGMAALIEDVAVANMAGVTDVREATVRAYFGITPPKGTKDRRKWLKAAALDKASELCNTEITVDDIADAVLLLKYTEANMEIKS